MKLITMSQIKNQIELKYSKFLLIRYKPYYVPSGISNV